MEITVMEYIAHRINTVAELLKLPAEYGVVSIFSIIHLNQVKILKNILKNITMVQ